MIMIVILFHSRSSQCICMRALEDTYALLYINLELNIYKFLYYYMIIKKEN